MNSTAEKAKKFTAVEIDFYFEERVISQKDYANIKKKVTTLAKNSEYPAIVSIFTSASNVKAIISFDITGAGFGIYADLFSRLNRLINSHKQPATYGWDNDSFGAN
jgi:hypothetical protein